MSEDDKSWQKDAYCFAYDLYSFLFKKRGMSQHMPPPVAGCDGTSHFTEEAGKTVLYTWHMSRDMYRHICTATYPAFAKNRSYLLVFFKEICEKCEPHNIFLKVLNMSVVILETYSFLLEKENTKFLPSVATVWAYLFGHFFKEQFLGEGGWASFKRSVAESARHYDQVASHFEEGYIFNMKDVARIKGLPYPEIADKRPFIKSRNPGSSHAKVSEGTQQKQPRRAAECEMHVPSRAHHKHSEPKPTEQCENASLKNVCKVPAQLADRVEHSKPRPTEQCENVRLKKASKKPCKVPAQVVEHPEPRPNEHCENVRFKKATKKPCVTRETLKLSRNLAANIRKECHSSHPPLFDDERVPPLHPGIELEPPSASLPEESGGVRRKTYSRGQSYAQRKQHKESLASTSKQSNLVKEQGCLQTGKSCASGREIPYACQKTLLAEQVVRPTAREKNDGQVSTGSSEESLTPCVKTASNDFFDSFNELKLEPDKPASSGSDSAENLNTSEPFEVISDIKALERNSLSGASAGKSTFGAAACNINMKTKNGKPVNSKRKSRKQCK